MSRYGCCFAEAHSKYRRYWHNDGTVIGNSARIGCSQRQLPHRRHSLTQSAHACRHCFHVAPARFSPARSSAAARALLHGQCTALRYAIPAESALAFPPSARMLRVQRRLIFAPLRHAAVTHDAISPYLFAARMTFWREGRRYAPIEAR